MSPQPYTPTSESRAADPSSDAERLQERVSTVTRGAARAAVLGVNDGLVTNVCLILAVPLTLVAAFVELRALEREVYSPVAGEVAEQVFAGLDCAEIRARQGTETTDVYSLFGVSAALKQAEQACAEKS